MHKLRHSCKICQHCINSKRRFSDYITATRLYDISMIQSVPNYSQLGSLSQIRGELEKAQKKLDEHKK